MWIVDINIIELYKCYSINSKPIHAISMHKWFWVMHIGIYVCIGLMQRTIVMEYYHSLLVKFISIYLFKHKHLYVLVI